MSKTGKKKLSYIWIVTWPNRCFKFTGKKFCVDTYDKLSLALYEGGVDGFILESLNCWEEAYLALEGVKLMIKVLIFVSL